MLGIVVEIIAAMEIAGKVVRRIANRCDSVNIYLLLFAFFAISILLFSLYYYLA